MLEITTLYKVDDSLNLIPYEVIKKGNKYLYLKKAGLAKEIKVQKDSSCDKTYNEITEYSRTRFYTLDKANEIITLTKINQSINQLHNKKVTIYSYTNEKLIELKEIAEEIGNLLKQITD